MGIKIGQWLNEYLKSYGTYWVKWSSPYVHYFWPRRVLVNFIGSIIAQIEESEYRKIRSSTIWQTKGK